MRLLIGLALLLASGGVPVRAQAPDRAEEAAAARLDAAAASPVELRMFLQAMPKGGDLHSHLSGAPYAESYLEWAAADGYCIDEQQSRLVPPPCAGRPVRGMAEREPFAFGRLVDALSTRGWQRGERSTVSGHEQFFTSFDRFGAVADTRVADSIAVVRRLAARDNAGYVEVIHDPVAMMTEMFRSTSDDAPLDVAGLDDAYRGEIARIAPIVAKGVAELDRDERNARRILGCDGPRDDAGCGVAIRYLAWGPRLLPPRQAFRSLIMAFALAERDPRYVGVNIVEPEDAPVALRDYDLHMAMFAFLARKFPRVHRSLHAGELAFGLVPPPALRDHIAKAVAIGGAERIGHGTDIAYEADAADTLALMARRKIPVEINLTSNSVILGVSGGDHPLRTYLKAGVPVVLSTDDEGLLRTDLTAEYARAVREHHLGYKELKTIARSSLQYAFVPGASLWKDGVVGALTAACADGFGRGGCRALLRSSEKARLQADLETRFAMFEHAQANDASGTPSTPATSPAP